MKHGFLRRGNLDNNSMPTDRHKRRKSPWQPRRFLDHCLQSVLAAVHTVVHLAVDNPAGDSLAVESPAVGSLAVGIVAAVHNIHLEEDHILGLAEVLERSNRAVGIGRRLEGNRRLGRVRLGFGMERRGRVLGRIWDCCTEEEHRLVHRTFATLW